MKRSQDRAMDDRDIRVLLRAAADRRLSALQGDPELARRIIARTKGEKPRMKKKLPLALAAAILLIGLFTVALAAGALHGFGLINWKGEFLPETQEEPAPTPLPEGVAREREMRVSYLLSDPAAGELLAVFSSEEDSSVPWGSVEASRSFPSFEALASGLGEAAAWLPLPKSLPEGYTLEDARVYLACRVGHEYTLSGEEETEDGFTVRHYTLDDEDGFVRGYSLDFWDPEGHYLNIYAKLYPLSDGSDFAIGINEGQAFATLSVPGMDDAVFVSSDSFSFLVMRRALEEEIEMVEPLFSPPDLSQETVKAPTEALSEVHIDVATNNGLTREELVSLFE